MPQLDTIPFASIYLSLFIVFFIGYFIFLKYFLPRISTVLKLQNKDQLNNIYWLFIYQFLLMKKDILSNEALIKTANLLCSLQLVLKYLDLLAVELIDLLFATHYEKGSIYILKQCFFFKNKFPLF